MFRSHCCHRSRSSYHRAPCRSKQSRPEQSQHALIVDARQAAIRQTVVEATCSPFLSVVLQRENQPNLVVDEKGRISHGTATAKTGNVDIESSFQLRRVSVPEGVLDAADLAAG